VKNPRVLALMGRIAKPKPPFYVHETSCLIAGHVSKGHYKDHSGLGWEEKKKRKHIVDENETEESLDIAEQCKWHLIRVVFAGLGGETCLSLPCQISSNVFLHGTWSRKKSDFFFVEKAVLYIK
jgi:hypothetical protein